MASEEQMGSTSPNLPLYDYIYRDSNRIASYYAQFFKGVLESIESISTKTGAVEIGQGQDSDDESTLLEHRSSQRQVSSKRTFAAHDLVTNDVISRLLDPNVVSRDIENAPHGSVVLVKGTVVFVDRHVPQMAANMLPYMAAQGGLADIPDGVSPEFIGAFMSTINFPSAFLLQLEELDQYEIEIQVVGTLKDEGMEEPISSSYFKYGSDGLADVYLLGIKEERNPSVVVPDAKLLGMGQLIAQVLSDLMFPEEAIRVTPIAMFRRLQQNERSI